MMIGDIIRIGNGKGYYTITYVGNNIVGYTSINGSTGVPDLFTSYLSNVRVIVSKLSIDREGRLKQLGI